RQDLLRASFAAPSTRWRCSSLAFAALRSPPDGCRRHAAAAGQSGPPVEGVSVAEQGSTGYLQFEPARRR
ncbi:hypothetical protein GBAR_LOCUS2261, partial [Geodia barretti]